MQTESESNPKLKVTVLAPSPENQVLAQVIDDVGEAPPDKAVALVRAAAAKAVAAAFPDDPASDRDDRIREAMTMFMARAAQRASENIVGTEFNSGPLSMGDKIAIIQEAMTFLQSYKGLTGHEKKAAVVRCLLNAFKRYKPDASQAELDDVGALATSSIELAINAKKGKIDGAQLGQLAADVVISGCMNGWCCVPKKPKNSRPPTAP